MAELAERVLRRPQTAQSRAVLSELIAAGPSSSKARTMMSDVLVADKRLSSILAFIPLVGPWRIQRSGSHSRAEKFWLTWLSIGLTALGVWAIAERMPTAETELQAFRLRIAADAKNLAGFADRHRAERGTYPDQSAWQHFADRADPIFFDPWGRRYRYDSSAGAVTISTLGRDGAAGGDGEDADITERFHPASSLPPQR
jgi:hypothetical protein